MEPQVTQAQAQEIPKDVQETVRIARKLDKEVKDLTKQLEPRKGFLKEFMKADKRSVMDVDGIPVHLIESERRSFDIDEATVKHGEELVKEFTTVTEVQSLKLNG